MKNLVQQGASARARGTRNILHYTHVHTYTIQSGARARPAPSRPRPRAPRPPQQLTLG